jgi:acetyl esterase/lipase
MAEFRTVTYAGPARELAIDIFEPEDSTARTAIVILHGGGLRMGARTAVHNRAAALAERGFVACAAEYRLLGEAPWPAPLDDALAALEWVRSNADSLGIDPGRVVVQGQSAGGYIALLVGARAHPQAVVAYYASIGLHPEPTPTNTAAGLAPIEQAPDGTIPSYRVLGDDLAGEHISDASPIRQIDGDFPPTLLFHGGADWMVRPFSTVIFYDRLTALGVPTDLHLLAGQSHEFDLAPSMLEVTTETTAAFVRRYVSDPGGAAEEAATFNPMFSAPH